MKKLSHSAILLSIGLTASQVACAGSGQDDPFALQIQPPTAIKSDSEQQTPKAPEAGTYPNPQITPGAVSAQCTVKDICTPGYTKRVRHVPRLIKEASMKLYGLDPKTSPKYELDHFISLELCGSNEITNLWPEPLAGLTYGAYEKDKLENHLHHQVCAGQISLVDAQKAIKDDWVKAFKACCEKAPAALVKPVPVPLLSAPKK